MPEIKKVRVKRKIVEPCAPSFRVPSQPKIKAERIERLRPHMWKPGQSGNPKGRPGNAGASIIQWLNAMADWEVEDIEHLVARRSGVPYAKRVAAFRMLAALSSEKDAGPEFDRICDRTNGRPTQTVTMSMTADDVPNLTDEELAAIVNTPHAE